MGKKAVDLDASYSALTFPDGRIARGVLKNLLCDAVESGLEKNQLVIVTNHRRVKDFDEYNPAWEDVESRVPLRELFDMYKKLTGKDYVQPAYKPTLEEKYRRRL